MLNMRNYAILSLSLCVLAMQAPFACGQATADLQTGQAATERNALLSRLQQMSHGTYTEAEWQELYNEMHALLDDAEQAGDHAEVIAVTLLLARVQSDMRGRHTDALYTLSGLKERYVGKLDVPVERIYAGLAEVYSRLGNKTAIEALIVEFKAGPHYDPEAYDVVGGDDPDTPVMVTRPEAKGNASLTVTTMERFARAASFAPGNMFPAFSVTTSRGATLTLKDYRGKVLLVDFWVAGWPSWRNNLPFLKSTYERFHPLGFEILGISLDPNAATTEEFVSEQRLPWPQVIGDRSLMRQCGVTGEPKGFLVDPQGRILGRDLDMPALVEKIQAALGK